MDNPMHANVLKELKARMAQKAGEEVPRTPINIGFGLGSPSSFATDSSNSPPYFTPSGSADSWDSPGRPSSGPASSPPTFNFSNPLYADSPDHPSSNEIQEERPFADFRSAEVHHREPLTRPFPSGGFRFLRNPHDYPIDVDPIAVTVIDPGGSFVYKQAGSPKRTLLARLTGVARHLWPASALAQAPVWFEQWWNHIKARQPARSKARSAWSLIRAGELDLLDLDSQALWQIGAFLLLAILVALLIYLVIDNQEQSRQGISVAAAGDGKPNGRVIYMTRSQFKREQARRKKAQPAEPSTTAVPSVAKVPAPDSASLYEYPPRRAI